MIDYDAVRAGITMIILALSAGLSLLVIAGAGVAFERLCNWLDKRKEAKEVKRDYQNIK